MEEQKWYLKIYEKLEEIKNQLEPGDFKFYNIAHFPLLAKYTEKNAVSCSQCSENIKSINDIVASLPEALNSQSSKRGDFEAKKTKVEAHLRKSHHMRFPGYYASLSTLIGVSASFVFSLIVNYLAGKSLLNDITIIASAIGLIAGISIGRMLDRNIFLKNQQL